MNEGSIILPNNEVTLQSELLQLLKEKEIGNEKIVDKLIDLMDAKTLNNKGDEMNDNRIQFEALKLLLKIKGVKLDQGINFNFFNIPNPNDKLKY